MYIMCMCAVFSYGLSSLGARVMLVISVSLSLYIIIYNSFHGHHQEMFLKNHLGNLNMNS